MEHIGRRSGVGPARRRQPGGPLGPRLHRTCAEPAKGRRCHRVRLRLRKALPRRHPRPSHRGIVDWDTSGRQDATLVVSALARTGHRAEVIHHANKGSTYTSLDFAFAAGTADMSSTGNAYDNAAMETSWARLKVEIGWIRGSIWFDNRAEAHAHLFEFIEVFHNRQRHQADLGHLTPAEHADKWRHDHGQPNLPQPRAP